MFRCNHDHQGAHYLSLLNVNFNTFLKTLYISWCKNFDNIKVHGTTVKKRRRIVKIFPATF